MKINLAKSAGFCFGVKRALDIAFNTANLKAKVYMLGDIVHNEKVVKAIEQAGIKKILKLTPGKERILLIRAHGASNNIFKKASCLGYRIVDATCPMVKEIHRIAKVMEQKGYAVIIIGDQKHDEVRGIVGQLKKKAILIDNLKHIPFKKIRQIKRAAVVVQSTQNLKEVLKIIGVLRKYIKELEFFNTICRPTRMKQQEIKIMPSKNDIMIIIGSKKSANTRRLYEISKRLNKRSYWITSKQEIKPEWFKGNVLSVGVASGSSTPESTTNEVIKYLKQLS